MIVHVGSIIIRSRVIIYACVLFNKMAYYIHLKEQVGRKDVRNDCAVRMWLRSWRWLFKAPVQDTTYDPVAKLQILIRWR